MERSDGVDISSHCQRCGSTNTKFCYYNNYSLTQPRYFCKGCRRYWTKGGSLRNVPVGGGCRKSRKGRPVTISRYPAKGLDANCVTSTDTVLGSFGSSSAPIIDLAAVYANFLKHESKQEPEPAKNLPKGHKDCNFELTEVRTGSTPGPSILEPQWDDSTRATVDVKNCEEMRDPAAIFDSTTPFELPPLPNEDGLLFPHTAEWFGSQLVGSNEAPPVYRLPDEFSHERHDINQLVDNWSSFDF